MKEVLALRLNSLADTEKLASQLAGVLIMGGVSLGLSGPLGGGKTTFTRALVGALGINRDEVSSPTYVLQQIYSSADIEIHHWDLYRVKGCPDDLVLPIPSGCIRIVEWPENAPELEHDIQLTFKLPDPLAEDVSEIRDVEISGRLLPSFSI